MIELRGGACGLADEVTEAALARDDLLEEVGDVGALEAQLLGMAAQMHLEAGRDADGVLALTDTVGPVVLERAPARRKAIAYDPARLPRLDPAKEYAASDVVTAAMKVFARDPAVVSIDSDLATTSGLEAGVAAVDQRRALNVGVAEANMMGIGEAFAALGYHTWISTFCPFLTCIQSCANE